MHSFLLTAAIYFVQAFVQIAHAKPLRIAPISQINFGVAVPGDGAKKISPGTQENSTNGSFHVTGDSSRAFSIILPQDPILLKVDKSPTSDTIELSNFESYPSKSGLLDRRGEQFVYVGATRSSLRLNQKAGVYTGQYTVTVVY